MTTILPHHLADLRRSGLSDQTIRWAGIRSETDPAKIAAGLRWNRPANIGPAIEIPYPQLSGGFNGFARFKPDRPRVVDGKPHKYEQPLGVPNHAYFGLRASIELLLDTGPVLVTEGEKKTLAADQSGVPTIGICGPWGWTKKMEKGQERELIYDLQDVDWNGRVVAILWDLDAKRNPNVHQGFITDQPAWKELEQFRSLQRIERQKSKRQGRAAK